MSVNPDQKSDIPSLAELATAQALRSLSSALGDITSKTTFACGGKIPVILDPPLDCHGNLAPRTASQVSDQLITTKPVTIRYGPQGEGQVLTLPTDTAKDPAFLNLITTCEPATFGLDGKDVYDESYRKVTKLDTSEFCSDFCPYQTGIVDIVSQLLMPSVRREIQNAVANPAPSTPSNRTSSIERAVKSLCRHLSVYEAEHIFTSRPSHEIYEIMQGYQEAKGCSLEEALEQAGRFRSSRVGILLQTLRDAATETRVKMIRDEYRAESKPTGRRIRAELYKLNVYSGPLGMFKAHVDTPRSESQIGSLVVCLPSDFEGGALSVRHQGNTVEFDWSSNTCADTQPAIQWAAFYSDCEHEVHEVTAGHRITLTYNLYASRGTGLLAGQHHSLDSTKLPLYQPLVGTLETPGFMTTGGTLGVSLSHAYPHTHGLLYHTMPKALKGVDMMLYETLLASKLDFKFVRLIDGMQVNWINEERNDSVWSGHYQDKAIQEGFKPMQIPMGMWETDELENDLMSGWKRLKDTGVEWLRCEGHQEPEVAYMAYGNNAEMAVKYSKVVILVETPPWYRRGMRSETRE